MKLEVIVFSSTAGGSISEMKEEHVQMEDQHRQLADPTLPRWLQKTAFLYDEFFSGLGDETGNKGTLARQTVVIACSIITSVPRGLGSDLHTYPVM